MLIYLEDISRQANVPVIGEPGDHQAGAKPSGSLSKLPDPATQISFRPQKIQFFTQSTF
jgi:hypothetical protein